MLEVLHARALVGIEGVDDREARPACRRSLQSYRRLVPSVAKPWRGCMSATSGSEAMTLAHSMALSIDRVKVSIQRENDRNKKMRKCLPRSCKRCLPVADVGAEKESDHCFVCLEENGELLQLCNCSCLVAHVACIEKVIRRGSGNRCKICNEMYRCEAATADDKIDAALHSLARAAAVVFCNHAEHDGVMLEGFRFQDVIQSLYFFHEFERDGRSDAKEAFEKLALSHEEPVAILLSLGSSLQPYPDEKKQDAFIDVFRTALAPRAPHMSMESDMPNEE